LAQWEGDLEKARASYLKLLEKAGGDFSDTTALANARLKEIEENRPMEYNLKMFLQASLGDNFIAQRLAAADLSCRPYRLRPDEQAVAEATPQPAQTGCIPIAFNYLWSGHNGEKEPPADERLLKFSHKYSGTKEINLVIVSPTGIIAYAFDLVDVY